MSRRYGGQSPLAVNAIALGLSLPYHCYHRRLPSFYWPGPRTERIAEQRLPHFGQLKNMQRRGITFHQKHDQRQGRRRQHRRKTP